MTLSLDKLAHNKGVQKNRTRRGRGNGSGLGTYSGRGLKGQKARSGVSGLKRLGMKKMILSVPKKRGFKSRHPQAQVINLAAINDNFKAGETVSPKTLKAVGLLAKMNTPVKILGTGELKISNLIFTKVKLSKIATEKIVKSKGEIK